MSKLSTLLSIYKSLYNYVTGAADYQYTRFPKDQYKLISMTNPYRESKTSLEIGCNAGLLVRMMQEEGKFSVGIDQLQPRKPAGAVVGGFQINSENVSDLPNFDLILLLSVHHQWVASHGDNYARSIFSQLIKLARRAVYVEFASKNSKFGHGRGELFEDDEEDSIKNYARKWLRDSGVSDGKITYLGPSRENPPLEPFRYIFMIEK